MHRFRGMFAFAIWDAPRRRLLLARDRLGIKPLYWAVRDGRLIFASEIKAIFESGLVQPRANEGALSELLATRYVSGEETLFAGVYKLLPGHLLAYEDGRVSTRQYWDVPLGAAADGPTLPGREWVARFRALLEESVRLRLMADVPLGMFLSGGLDSSAIAAIMARLIDRPLQTFTVAFEEQAFSELAFARDVARAIGADGHEVVIGRASSSRPCRGSSGTRTNPSRTLERAALLRVGARPQARHGGADGRGQRRAARGVRQVSARPRQLAPRAACTRVAREPVRRWITERVVPALPARLARYARRSFLAVDHTPEAAFFDNFAAVPLARQRELLGARLRATATPEQAYGTSRAWLDRAGHRPLLDRVLYADIKTYLVELLMKQDQMSMAASIESRVPFLDHKLVEFAATMPPEWKLSGSPRSASCARRRKTCCPPRSCGVRRWGFPCPSRCGRAAAGTGGAGRAARSPRPGARTVRARAGDASARRSRRRPLGWRRRALEPAQSRALVPHVDRRRRRAAARRGVGPAPLACERQSCSRQRARGNRCHAMTILWLSAGLLLPLDKGGKLRTWHLMRHLARRHDITVLSYVDPAATPEHVTGCRRSAAPS